MYGTSGSHWHWSKTLWAGAVALSPADNLKSPRTLLYCFSTERNAVTRRWRAQRMFFCHPAGGYNKNIVQNANPTHENEKKHNHVPYHEHFLNSQQTLKYTHFPQMLHNRASKPKKIWRLSKKLSESACPTEVFPQLVFKKCTAKHDFEASLILEKESQWKWTCAKFLTPLCLNSQLLTLR